MVSEIQTQFVVPTIGDAARFFRRSSRTVADWLARGCPGRRGAYDLSAMVEWVREHVPLRSVAPGGKASGDDDGDGLDREKLRKLQLANAKDELRLKKMAGELVPFDEILAWMEQTFAGMAARISQWPSEAASGIPSTFSAEIVETLTEKARLMMREMSEWQTEGVFEQSVQRMVDAAWAAENEKRKARIEAIAEGGILAPGGGFV